MNTQMFENPIVQDNLKKLEHYGYEVIQPAVGLLACKDVGKGKMPEPETLLEYILQEVAYEKDLKGKKNPCDSRTDPGTDRSGAVSDKSLQRENGVCDCKSL